MQVQGHAQHGSLVRRLQVKMSAKALDPFAQARQPKTGRFDLRRVEARTAVTNG